MASVDLTQGDGTIKAGTNTVAGVSYPVVNVGFGPSGSAPDQVDTGTPLPVTVEGLVDVSGSAIAAVISDGGGSITVDNAGTFAVQAAQSGAWSISFTAPQHIIVDSGTLTTVSTVTTITNVVHVDDNGGSLTIDGTVAVSALSGTSAVKGGTAADAALANAPVTIGGRATNTNLSEMSADGDVVDLQMTMQGAVVVADAPRELLGNQQTQLSNTTSETTIVTAASGVFNDLYGLILANTGASATKVSIRDDTGGTVRAIIYVPANDTRGLMLPAGSAISQTATNKNWTAQCGTATTALEVTALYVKRK